MNNESVDAGISVRQVAPCSALASMKQAKSAWHPSPEYFYIECEL